jgi:hypothetical protein
MQCPEYVQRIPLEVHLQQLEEELDAGLNDSEAVLNAQKGMVDEIMSKASHLPEEDRPPRAAFTRYFPQDKRVEWLLYLSHMVEGVRPHEMTEEVEES